MSEEELKLKALELELEMKKVELEGKRLDLELKSKAFVALEHLALDLSGDRETTK